MMTVPGILSATYLSSPLVMMPSAPITTDTVSDCIFQLRAISISKSFSEFLNYLNCVKVFLSDGTAMSIICPFNHELTAAISLSV